MTQPTIGIGITADDKTAKGFTSAERRASRTNRAISEGGKRWAKATQESASRSSGGILRTFGQVEQAGARLFGGRSMSNGITSRLGAIGEAAGAARAGMTGAAEAGGILETAAGAAGVAVAGTIGILAAAGYAAFKLADGWAKGAATIGRTAETIGVATKALQEFEAAGQRQGMADGAATATLGNISQTLNDARYGRNSAALSILGRIGVKMQTNADGTVDVAAMLPAIADGIARYNSSGRRTIAKGLGIGLDALPVFAQGGAALKGEFADAADHASMIDDAGIVRGRRIARKGVMVGQLKDRAVTAAGGATAGAVEGGYDAVLQGGQALTDGTASFGGIVSRTFAPAAGTIARAADKIEGAGEKLLVAARTFFENRGWTRAQASGIVAGFHRESLLRPGAVGDGGKAYGIGQWHEDRQANFRRVYGHDIRGSSREEQLGFADWEFRNTERRAGRKLSETSTAYDAGAVVSRYYERPADRDGEAHIRGRDADHLAKIDVHVTDARVKVTASRHGSNRPAVSRAMLD